MEKMNFPEMEEKILKFWEENKIFEKSLEINKKSPKFIFYEGPPYANGKPGIHHVLGRVFKDLFCRYKTMRGFFVERKGGWDTHGLPVEVQTEKELGFKTKKEIENYGIAEFNKKCKENVWKYKDEWDEITKRIGFWLDLEHPYITYENYYIESLWWIIKQIYEKGLLIQDYRVAPYCPRCGTTLSSHELAQEYKKIKEDSIYVKFQITKHKLQTNSKSQSTNHKTHFLVWTTTPWTLPGNVALAVNPNIDYVLVENKGENLILAKERLKVIDENYKIIKEFKGKELLDTEYEPLYKFIEPDKKAYCVVSGDFVSTEEGTGIVHIAPAFGEDDMKVGKENDLPVLMTVNKEGKFIDNIKPWAGKFVKDADPEITKELENRKLLYEIEKYEHDYPFCWRCESPLLYYALTSWFVEVTKIKNKLIENNKNINWFPGYLKEGRFGEWLRDVKDWNFSRERYWGVPLPIWKCQGEKSQNTKNKLQTNSKSQSTNHKQCRNTKVIGSIEELEKLGNKKIDDLHRPYVDDIIFECDECDGEMHRVLEVADIWFDSGSMPFAQGHWPFAQNKNSKIKNKKCAEPPANYPAEFICEGVDQTRGWFYTLLAVATLLGFESPYKNVVSYGLVLDKHGKKMSKSKGNVVNVQDIIDKFGVDALRWYFYTVNATGMPTKFDENDVQKTFRRFIMTLWNTFSFWKIYSKEKYKQLPKLDLNNKLDKWILSKFNVLTEDISKKLDKYDLVGSARNIESFLDDFSNWYLRLSRGRLKQEDNKEVYEIFSYILVNFVKLTAPFIPFTSDHIFKEMTDKKSVHLEKFPELGEIDEKIIKQMETVRNISSIGLELRAKAEIKVRQPLATLSANIEIDKDLLDILKDQVNVKEIVFDKDELKKDGWVTTEEGNFKIALDTNLTDALKEEGTLREIIRNIQSFRKNAGLTPQDKIVLNLYSDDKQIADIIVKNKEKIKKDTILSDIVYEKIETSEEISIEGRKLFIGIKK